MSREELAALLAELNADPRVHGILLQLPLPDHLDDAEMTALIDPAKDVDGLTPTNAGLLMHGRDALVACTPTGVMELLDHAGVELSGAGPWWWGAPSWWASRWPSCCWPPTPP